MDQSSFCDSVDFIVWLCNKQFVIFSFAQLDKPAIDQPMRSLKMVNDVNSLQNWWLETHLRVKSPKPNNLNGQQNMNRAVVLTLHHEGRAWQLSNHTGVFLWVDKNIDNSSHNGLNIGHQQADGALCNPNHQRDTKQHQKTHDDSAKSNNET